MATTGRGIIYVQAKTHKALKIRALQQDKTLTQLVDEILSDYFVREREEATERPRRRRRRPVDADYD